MSLNFYLLTIVVCIPVQYFWTCIGSCTDINSMWRCVQAGPMTSKRSILSSSQEWGNIVRYISDLDANLLSQEESNWLIERTLDHNYEILNLYSTLGDNPNLFIEKSKR